MGLRSKERKSPLLVALLTYTVELSDEIQAGNKFWFLLEIVMNELRKLGMSADFFANSSHIIESAPLTRLHCYIKRYCFQFKIA